MRRHLAMGLAALGALYFVPQVWASTTLTASITNDAENPPTHPTLVDGVTPRPASFGTATFVLNDAQTAMTMTATVNNIDFTGTQTPDTNDNLTNAHIHAGAGVTPTTNGGVVWGFIGTPQNTANDVVVTPFAAGAGVGGMVTATWDQAEGQNTTLTAQLANILNNRAYINFHTNQFSGGEVRGNLVVVPEPTSGLLGAGFVGLILRRHRR